jgi:hypothetical protein
MTLSQLRCSLFLIHTDLWHIIDQNEKAIKLHIIWFIKLKNFDKMEKINSNFAIICLIGYHYDSKYTQIYGIYKWVWVCLNKIYLDIV